ncbi:3-methyl-2-oxobutanoate hydroxymethyltransferase [Gilvimarinus sp. SDUM040013]|uniref:3-methyl-2-oxobutanoate hydroxymethyltransferase n=1 Tax=Gilvimarinus gilvus TaxID=3058038 RepID=A0ABU4RZR1_9GAMM|nr:3-methyl-2-oxobutanoate hydroxymethyltransferase [Gilvimarinus sp. SDUM040013]MDO3386096.1 3-methyl-2-oxobutanoate hydroxymethyltransferase [Gilvimarinus sp. SDUM040013]MDX6850363.1 3-methyl-2-oxobutanoate hydroxymethyltransferase [Gilvimarinus sp. SDUM040013]
MPYVQADNTGGLEKKVTLQTLHKMRGQEKFVMVSLYDAPMAAMAQKCSVEAVLIGDSLGMTVLGYDSVIPVTMEQMIYHVEAVARGNNKSLIIGDLPFMTYATPQQALENAARIMRSGAHMVKIEGGAWLAETIQMLTDRGIPVCAHIGLTPQSVHKFGGFRVQGRQTDRAQTLLEDTKILNEAGADLLLVECVPSALGTEITKASEIPVIGIGAGDQTDAQVLVINDILGLTPQPPKFSKNFLQEAGDIPSALKLYRDHVKAGTFPAQEHQFT